MSGLPGRAHEIDPASLEWATNALPATQALTRTANAYSTAAQAASSQPWNTTAKPTCRAPRRRRPASAR